MDVVLVHPEIAPNTGAIIRLCANAGLSLHLVEPLGFSLDERALRRAGLDYHELAPVTVHPNLDHVADSLRGRWFAFTSSSTNRYTDIEFRPDDVLVFGAERAGLGTEILERFDPAHVLTIPMMPGNRSLNLANAVSVVAYEAWRQMDFAGAAIDHLETSQASHGLTAENLAADNFDT